MSRKKMVWNEKPITQWQKNLAYLLFVLGLIATLTGCNNTKAQSHPKVAPHIEGNRITFPAASDASKTLSVVTAKKSTQHLLKIPGRLAWNEDQTVRIFSPFDGRVTQIPVHVGQKVEAGQTLAMIQSPDFNAVQADFLKATSDVAFAKKKLARLQELYRHGISARKELEEAETDYASAKADLKRAQARLKPYSDPAHPTTDQFHLKSPLSGIVVQKAINPGQELISGNESTPLFVITNPTSLWAWLDAREDTLADLNPNETFNFVNHSYPQERFSGIVVHVADYVDPVTRTVKVLAQVPNPQRKLKAEMYVTAEIPVHAMPELLVPTKAVILDGDHAYIFISKSGERYIRRQVRVGLEEEHGMVSILSGISAEEPVVAEGAIYLQQLLQAAHQPL